LLRAISENGKHGEKAESESRIEINSAQEAGYKENEYVEYNEYKEILPFSVDRHIDDSDQNNNRNEVHKKPDYE